MDDLAIMRVLHVLGVVIWIGGVGMVTAVVLPEKYASAEERMRVFEAVESRLWIARAMTLLVGFSGLWEARPLGSVLQSFLLVDACDGLRVGDFHLAALRSRAAASLSPLRAAGTQRPRAHLPACATGALDFVAGQSDHDCRRRGRCAWLCSVLSRNMTAQTLLAGNRAELGSKLFTRGFPQSDR